MQRDDGTTQHTAYRAPAIAPFFEARSVAVIGASERAGSLGAVVFANILAAGFEGPVYPVNPRHEQVAGRRCWASARDIHESIDLAVIATPAVTVPAVLDDCGVAGIRAAIVLSAGFRETGEAGKVLEAELVDAARRHRIRVIGPNCLGVLRPDIALNASFSQCMARSGGVALVSQSGAMCTAMLDWAGPRNVGFSCVVSMGIGADVGLGEILDYLVIDNATRAIMLYVEGVNDARRFMSALRAAARAKPVVVMKAGRYAEGRRAAKSHTGALVGADDVFDAALSRAGVVRVHDYADFFAVAATLHYGVRTPGSRLAIVTNGGGPGVMAADFLVDRGLPLAELSAATRDELAAALPAAGSVSNPVDVLGDADAGRYAAALETCLADPGVDAALAIVVPQAMTDPGDIAARVSDVAAAAEKPVLTCWMGEQTVAASRASFRERSIPTYSTPEAAVEAFAAAAAYRANQEMLLQVPETGSPIARPDRDGAALIIEHALAARRCLLDPVESKALLSAFGIPVLQSLPARSAAEAVALAEELGFPVAMKIHAPGITHKSDVGGVRLGLNGGRDVEAAYREMLAAVRAKAPEATLDGVLIEPMYSSPAGRELMLGVIDDPVFGPVISVGLGGTLVEVLGDRAIGLPPLNRLLARRMIDRSRAARLLDDFRGLPAVSRAALETVILRLSDMVCELPWLTELDINPLVVDDQCAVALDARVVVARVKPTLPWYGHMAIHPYPSKLAGEHRLADGTRLTVRLIRPEDAELEREFVNGLSEQSRYLRFMYTLRTISPAMIARFTQIDYDREMALIALLREAGAEKQIAVARYAVHPDGQSCEFAIVVADAWHGRGIATELLKRLIDIARDRGLERMDGVVLRENRGMLLLATELGFRVSAADDDPTVSLVSLDL